MFKNLFNMGILNHYTNAPNKVPQIARELAKASKGGTPVYLLGKNDGMISNFLFGFTAVITVGTFYGYYVMALNKRRKD
eukprot:Clim_evm8s227 gene=Clim_evmTU8s227